MTFLDTAITTVVVVGFAILVIAGITHRTPQEQWLVIVAWIKERFQAQTIQHE